MFSELRGSQRQSGPWQHHDFPMRSSHTPQLLMRRSEHGRISWDPMNVKYTPGFTPPEIRHLHMAISPRQEDRGRERRESILIHDGCVNTVAWSACGRFLYSGSDDRTIRIWDSRAGYRCRGIYLTSHRNNIFTVKPNLYNEEELLTCAADGTLRQFNIEMDPALSESSRRFERLVATSNSIMHGFEFWKGGGGPILFTAQDDGFVCRYDLRESNGPGGLKGHAVLGRRSPRGKLIPVKILAMPAADTAARGCSSYTLAVGGLGPLIELYDVRRLPSHLLDDDRKPTTFPRAEAVQLFQPHGLPSDPDAYFREIEVSASGLTFSAHRSELLASFQGDLIYTFNTGTNEAAATDPPPSSPLLHCPLAREESAYYGAHFNSQTFLKTVQYFGPREEYIVTGSDTGHTWIFDRQTGTVANVLWTDESISNGCIPHPFYPTLACYGIDHTIKVLQIEAAQDKADVKRPKGADEAAMEAVPELDAIWGTAAAMKVSMGNSFVMGKSCMVGLGELLEAGISRLRRGQGKAMVVFSQVKWLTCVKRIRRSRQERKGGTAELPDYPTDLWSREEMDRFDHWRVMVDSLRAVKERGTLYFRQANIIKASLCYAKVLRYALWLMAERAAGRARKEQKETAPGHSSPRRARQEFDTQGKGQHGSSDDEEDSSRMDEEENVAQEVHEHFPYPAETCVQTPGWSENRDKRIDISIRRPSSSENEPPPPIAQSSARPQASAREDSNASLDTTEELAQYRELQISSLLNLSACALLHRHYNKAYQLSDMVLQAEPQHVKALFRRGSAALSMGDPEQAVADLSKAHQLEPQDRGLARKLAGARKALQSMKERERRAFTAFLRYTE